MTDLTEGQQFFTRSVNDFQKPLPTLRSAVSAIKPTILIGTSTHPGAFTEEIVKEMAAHTERPIIFPLSNPTELAEAKASDLIEWTDGRALIATGIPSSPVDYKGVTYAIGQANNALMYPGLGLGVIASTAKLVDQSLLSAAAHALGGIVDASQPGAAVLPPVNKITSFSQHLAEVVAQHAIDHQNTRENITDAHAAVEHIKWYPRYE
jgi:malic enzyme, NAD binding domain protein